MKVIASFKRRLRQTAAELPTTKAALAKLNEHLNQEGFTVNGEVVKVRGYSMVSCLVVSAFAGVSTGPTSRGALTSKHVLTMFGKAATTAGFDSADNTSYYNMDTKEGILQVVYNPVGGGYTFHYTSE